MINVVIALVTMVGCVSVDEPAPAVVLVGEPVPLPLGWEDLGFSFGDAGFDECTTGWYKFDELPCQITIGVVIVPMLRERTGANARTFRDQRHIEIDSSLNGTALDFAIAHEVGHILLDTSEHTNGGIMGGSSLFVTDMDRALACRSIGRGC